MVPLLNYINFLYCMQIEHNISFKIFNHQPILYTTVGKDDFLLKWHEKDSFQIVVNPIMASSFPCATLPSGYIGAWVYFHRDSEGKVVNLTVPGLTYGVVFKKQK